MVPAQANARGGFLVGIVVLDFMSATTMARMKPRRTG